MKVFISHSESDRELADRLADLLERCGFRVWRDRIILRGQNWTQEIGRALEAANAMSALISPEPVKSRWGRKVLDYLRVAGSN